MASAQDAGERLWPPGFRVRATANPGTDRVEVADVVAGRYFHCHPDGLCLDVLAGTLPWERRDERPGGGLPEPAAGGMQRREALLDGWRHWQERGWQPSDQYYVASRRREYADEEDRSGDIRRSAIGLFLQREGPPAPSPPLAPTLALGDAAPPGEESVATLLAERRTARSYPRHSVPSGSVSGLLYHGLAGVRKRRDLTGPHDPLSYVESSFGSAWDVYLCVYHVEGIPPAAYRYEIADHALALARPGNHADAMVTILQGMNSPRSAALTLVLVADFPRYQWRYRHEHGLRRLYMESGIIAQELIVLAASYGLGTLVTPAQQDSPLLELLGLSPERYGPVYTVTMGPR